MLRVPAAVLVLLLGPPAMRAQDAGPPAATVPCCFTNPQYTGACTVQPAKGESCASIRAYLNDPRSQGKGYCSNTSTRGGWKRVTCARKNVPPSPTPSPR